MNLTKLARLVVILLSAVSIVFLAVIMASEDKDAGVVEPFIYVAYGTLFISVLLVLIYTLKNILSKKGELKRTFISIGAFLAIVVIAFIVSDDTIVPMKEGGELSSLGSRLVSTGLNTFYFLSIIAIVLMVLTGYNRIKK